MIICSKPEANGTYREFMLDNAQCGAEIRVKTHLAHRFEGGVVPDDDWTEAGVITRAANGLKAAVATPARGGKRAKRGLVKLDALFTNEVAALQAIALHYRPAARVSN